MDRNFGLHGPKCVCVHRKIELRTAARDGISEEEWRLPAALQDGVCLQIVWPFVDVGSLR